MAEVLLATMDAGVGAQRLVVLKRIWPELAMDPDFVTMFFDEAKLSLRLNHPNVVRTFEVLVDDNEVSIAMEYLDGQPLTHILNRLRGPGELSLPLRLRIVTNVLAGLEHAHTLTDVDGSPLGVIHRDVSPQNVFVTYDGQVKLVDFGVAKTLAASHHTRPGAIKGKLAYMAPEQLQRDVIDRRVDVFAAGVMLWEMLAGRRMWNGMTEVEIVAHLAMAKPMPPLPSERGLPPALDVICARALDPDPDRRYQTAAEMEVDLERVLVGAADSHARNLGKVVSLAFGAERAERQSIIERSSLPHAARSGTPAPVVTPAPLWTPGPTALSSVEIPLDDLPTAPEPVGSRRLWIRRIATVGALACLAWGGILLTEGGRQLVGARTPTHDGLAAGAAPAAAPAAPALAPAPAKTVEPAPSRPRRPHRRPAPAIDDDAVMPPSDDSTSP
jgi:serine/threonine-protein kinase